MGPILLLLLLLSTADCSTVTATFTIPPSIAYINLNNILQQTYDTTLANALSEISIAFDDSTTTNSISIVVNISQLQTLNSVQQLAIFQGFALVFDAEAPQKWLNASTSQDDSR